tara:strand:+ start:1336 stop:2583 length:1248 start_codon:yes stop_codon:yes gene_type:complete
LIYDFVYQYKDHLGNVRVNYTQDPQQNGELVILDESHYYPFGLQHSNYNADQSGIVRLEELNNEKSIDDTVEPLTPFENPGYKYKFGGKEQQSEFGIGIYDFGARNYDPALGRWMNIDPLAEMMTRHSPYNYAFNNPIYFMDPDGMAPVPIAVQNFQKTGSTASIGFGFSSSMPNINGFNVTTLGADGETLDSKNVSSLDGMSFDREGNIFTDGGGGNASSTGVSSSGASSAGGGGCDGCNGIIGIYGAGGENSGDGPELKKIVEGKGGTMYGWTDVSKIKEHIQAASKNGHSIEVYGYSRGGNTAVRLANAMPNILFMKMTLFDPHILQDNQRFVLTGANVREVHNYYQNNTRTYGQLGWGGTNPYLGSPITRQFSSLRSPGVRVFNYDLTGHYYSPGSPVSHNNIIRHYGNEN